MPTVVNQTPQPVAPEPNGNSMGFLFAAVLLILFVILFFVYALPLIRSGMTGTSPQVTIPNHYDVNVKQSK